MMGFGGYGLMGGFGGLGMVVGLLFWLALVVLVVWGASALFGGGSRAGSEDTPAEILRRRYARGEISQAEYEQAKQALA